MTESKPSSRRNVALKCIAAVASSSLVSACLNLLPKPANHWGALVVAAVGTYVNWANQDT